jgi:RND family efflux transporter MFP subunit
MSFCCEVVQAKIITKCMSSLGDGFDKNAFENYIAPYSSPTLSMKSILFLLIALLAACNKEAAPVAKTVRPALTGIAGQMRTSESRLYSGEIRAEHEPVLGFRIPGKIVERKVSAGQRVKAGQVLMRLDPLDQGLQADAAQAQYRLANSDAERYRKLYKKGFVSAAALDAREAALQSVKAQAELAHNQTKYTELRAGEDGIVEVVLADAGQVVSAGQPVLRIARAGEAEAAIDIPEDQLAGRHVGDAAEVQVGDGPFMKAHLRELSQSADAMSRTYPARVAFDEIPAHAALGMTARVRFKQAAQGALVIPLSAVYQDGKQTAVWIVAENHSVSLRRVGVSAYRDDGAVITSGLKAGERIVVAGVHRLSQGEIIQPVDRGSEQ